MPQIDHDGLADVDRERQPVVPGAFAVHHDFARCPVDVIQGQGGDLAGTQSESCQQGQDREVPPANGVVPVAGVQ
jgi:hypothetical protein